MSDEDSADEMEDDCKLMNGDVRNLPFLLMLCPPVHGVYLLLPIKGAVSLFVTGVLQMKCEFANLHVCMYFSALGHVSFESQYQWGPVLLSCLCNAVFLLFISCIGISFSCCLSVLSFCPLAYSFQCCLPL